MSHEFHAEVGAHDRRNLVCDHAFYGLIALILFALIFTWFYSTDARQLKAAWGSFPELPGEHLRWHQTARGVSQIVARDGRVLATIEGIGLLLHPWIVQVLGFWAPSLPPRLPRCVKVGQDTYMIGGWQENARVTGPDGMAALLFTERNFDHQGSEALGPDQSVRTGSRSSSSWAAR